MAIVRIIRNEIKIRAKIENGKKEMMIAVTEQVVKDSNIYCRQDSGTLISSSLSASRPERGQAIWDTPYALRVYYTGTPRKDVNPAASLMWVEVARAAFGGDWLRIAQKFFGEGMK